MPEDPQLRARPLTAAPPPAASRGASPEAASDLGARQPVRDTLLVRCIGWAVLTGASSGSTLMLFAELAALRRGNSFELGFVLLGTVFGALFAIPIGAAISAGVLAQLRRGLASDEPRSAVRQLLGSIVLGLNALVVLGAATRATELSLGNWLAVLACLLAWDLGVWPVLIAARRSLVRYENGPSSS